MLRNLGRVIFRQEEKTPGLLITDLGKGGINERKRQGEEHSSHCFLIHCCIHSPANLHGAPILGQALGWGLV